MGKKKGKGGIPDRWENYFPMGCPVAGTRFLPFKVPLKPALCQRYPENEWFTPSILLENTPMLKAVIDLTNTDRYYNSEEFTERGIFYKKINIVGGGKIPKQNIRQEFFNAVDQLNRSLRHDSDALIGVHCTHGLNRTGYLICKYMVLRMKIDPQEAISKFQEARGYPIERANYVGDIMSEGQVNWRKEDRISSSNESRPIHHRREGAPSYLHFDGHRQHSRPAYNRCNEESSHSRHSRGVYHRRNEGPSRGVCHRRNNGPSPSHNDTHSRGAYHGQNEGASRIGFSGTHSRGVHHGHIEEPSHIRISNTRNKYERTYFN